MTKKKSFLFMALCLIVGIAVGAGSTSALYRGQRTEKAEAAENPKSGYDMLGVSGGTEAEVPEEQQTYIVDLKLAVAYWDRYACNASSELRDKYGADYQRVQDFNLNRNCGTTTDCIYLYEQRSYDDSLAITNLIAVCSDKAIEETVAYDEYGIMYEVIDGIRINGLHSSVSAYDKIDLNMGAGGKYIYLYATRSTAYNPITDINIEDDLLEADLSYIGICSTTVTDRYQDFNQGAGGANVYIMFTRAITGWTVFHLNAVDYSEDGTEMVKTYRLAVRDKRILAEYVKPWIEKDEYAHFVGFRYDDGTAVNVGDGIVYDWTTIYADWTYDIVIDLSAFDQENVYKTMVDKIGGFPSVSKTGYLVKGWRFADTQLSAGPYAILNRGGIVEPILEKAHPEYFRTFVLSCELNQSSAVLLMNIFKNGLKDSVKYHGQYLADKYVLFTMGYEYVDGQIVKHSSTQTPVTTDVDCSSATEEEKTLIAQYAQYLFVGSDLDVIYTIDYYMNEGAEEQSEPVCAAVIDLAKKEMKRRGFEFPD